MDKSRQGNEYLCGVIFLRTPVLCEFAFTPLSALEKYPGNVVAKRSDRVKRNAAVAYQIFPTACCR